MTAHQAAWALPTLYHLTHQSLARRNLGEAATSREGLTSVNQENLSMPHYFNAIMSRSAITEMKALITKYLSPPQNDI